MKICIKIYSYILLLYSGWRTYDFIFRQMPTEMGNMRSWLSIVFLFTTEVGLLLWHETSLKHVTTHDQNTLTRWMVGVDLVGSLAAGIADLILTQTFAQGYKISPLLADFLIYGLPIIVFLNIVAVILFENFDAELQEDKAEKEVEFEIHQEAIKQLRKEKKALATEKKKAIYNDIRSRVTNRIDAEYGGDNNNTHNDQAEYEQEPSIGDKINEGIDTAIGEVQKILKRGRGRPKKTQTVFASETVSENPTLPEQ